MGQELGMTRHRAPAWLAWRRRLRIDPPVLMAFACIALLLIVGSFFSRNFLSPAYLLQQLQVASFLGVIAAGAMVVILLGHIDLSVPWTLTVGAMTATAAANLPFGSVAALLAAVLVGSLVGLVNGLGAAVLRVPSMIFTLGTNAVLNGMVVLYTGGFAPRNAATPFMNWIAIGHPILNIPNAVFAWILVSVIVAFMLRRTPFGRYVYAMGNSEGSVYLSGISTRSVLIAAFIISGIGNSLGGVLLAGYAGQAYQSMGDAYLLPAIAAVVLGGTNVLGGRGSYLGTVAGVLLITLLGSMLSVMQIAEAGRQIAYGAAIVVMLLAYGRSPKGRE